MAERPRVGFVSAGAERARSASGYDDAKDKPAKDVMAAVGEKRKSDGASSTEGPMEKKKFSMSVNSPKNEAPTKKISISLGLGKSTKPSPAFPTVMTVPTVQNKPSPDGGEVKVKTKAVAQIFNDEDSDDEDEEMPPEAKMRMKNIGRNTPTAAGPNSFGKGRLGFCDRQRILERDYKKTMDEIGEKD